METSFRKQKILFAATLWLLIAIGKVWYNSATVEDLLFILKPLKGSLELLGYADFRLTPEGYLNAQNYLISKDCSGFNFWLISTLVIGFAIGRKANYKIWLIPAIVILSYTATQLANISRISCLTFASDFISIGTTLHPAIGSVVYLSLLLSLYILFTSPLKNLTHVH